MRHDSKDKKKKCDEIRPQCARCKERGQDCVYEVVKPRQRRKRESVSFHHVDGDSSSSGSERAFQSLDPTIFVPEWKDEKRNRHTPFDAISVNTEVTEQSPLSGGPVASPIDSLFAWSPRDLPIMSPIDSVDFQFPNADGCVMLRQEDDVEEIIRRDSMTTANTKHYSNRSPSLALIAPISVPSPRFEFCSPSFNEFSGRTNRRALVDHFCNVLSHLIVFREECGNPFQQLVLPLCHNSQAVQNAVYALASAHLEYRGVENGEKSVYFHNKSIQGLARLIEQGGDVNRNELLAAIMLLVYYEVLVQKGRSNIVDGHLKGAMAIMSNNEVATDPTGVFLERAFRFYDVIAALSFGTAPISTAPGASYLTPFPPLDSSGASSPLGSVDTLLGMATSLWPIIHRLSNLLVLKDQLDAAVTHGELSKVAVLRTEFENTASAIETALEDWHPMLPPDSPLAQDPEGLTADKATERVRLQSILNNALAYRHSAFVYLYRTIYSYPRSHALVQRHTHVSLTHCVGTVNNAGPMGALLWPLFVSACEAISQGDRELARQAFVALDRRQGMMNIGRAWCIVQEVWKRADKAELMHLEEEALMLGVRSGGDLWRRDGLLGSRSWSTDDTRTTALGILDINGKWVDGIGVVISKGPKEGGWNVCHLYWTMTSSINASDTVLAPPRPIRFVHNQGQPPSKRRRINAARKTRCAGERPFCTTCTKNGHDCLGYPEDIKKEDGDKLGVGVEPDENEHDTHDSDDDEDDGTHHKAKTYVKGTPGIPFSSNTATETLLSTPKKPTITAKPIHLETPNLTTHHREPSQPLASLHDNLNSPGANRRSESHRVPYFRYFGPTAIVPGFKQMVVSVRDRRRSTGGSLPATSPISAHSAAFGGSSAAESDIAVEDLPVYDPNDTAPVHPLIIKLVEAFFLQMGSSYPFLRQKRFMRMVKEKRLEQILVDSVCALGARFLDVPALTGGNEKMPRTERGAAFAQRARQATVDTFPCPTVGAVQACLLMAYEGFGANQDSALWMYLGLAIRMAVDLGLQKEVGVQYQGEKDPWYTRNWSRQNGDEETSQEKPDDPSALSPEEQMEVVQERMDTFWAVFILDRIISSGTGRPVTLRDDGFELTFPEPFLDPATGWPAPFPIFLQIIHLYGRVCDVLNNVRHVQDLTRDKWDKLGDMEQQLTKMYKNWDPRLQFNVGNFKAYLGIGQGTTFILLHFWFHALFIILHQPTLLTPFGEIRSELQLEPDSRELSMSSAKTICDILSFADLIDPKSFVGNPFTSQPIYIAACAFLMESSANASETPSRNGTPPGSRRSDLPKTTLKNVRDGKGSRHSILASAANQNYQRCYNSLQQVHFYWGGVKYILTALDQKSKGIWDCETYTMEEYESTRSARRETRGTIGSQFPRFENQAAPKASGPPIAWSLAGTANSPSSSLTLMYQNLNTAVMQGPQPISADMRQASTPPGNMVYDPIRQSLPESGAMFPPPYPQPNTSAVRHSPQQLMPRRASNISGAGGPTRPIVKFDTVPEDAEDTGSYMMHGFTFSGQLPHGYETYNGLPSGSGEHGAVHQSRTPTGGAHNMYFPQAVQYQTAWDPSIGNMDSITFDSQDIDINTLGLQGSDLMGTSWLEYMPDDVLGLFGNPDPSQQ
ncbi:hypothetical protein G7046_g5698 [Stylonectria norvegica]|nr:hypothetical protein G7046_g5698 [Stylonectria norvegica]